MPIWICFYVRVPFRTLLHYQLQIKSILECYSINFIYSVFFYCSYVAARANHSGMGGRYLVYVTSDYITMWMVVAKSNDIHFCIYLYFCCLMSYFVYKKNIMHIYWCLLFVVIRGQLFNLQYNHSWLFTSFFCVTALAGRALSVHNFTMLHFCFAKCRIYTQCS